MENKRISIFSFFEIPADNRENREKQKTLQSHFLREPDMLEG